MRLDVIVNRIYNTRAFTSKLALANVLQDDIEKYEDLCLVYGYDNSDVVVVDGLLSCQQLSHLSSEVHQHPIKIGEDEVVLYILS